MSRNSRHGNGFAEITIEPNPQDVILADNSREKHDKNKKISVDLGKNTAEDISLQNTRKNIMQNWNLIAEEFALPKLAVVNDKRLRGYKARCKEIGGEDAFWNKIHEAIRNSSFLRGEKKDWSSSFDFFLQASSFIKAIEGNYNDIGSKASKINSEFEKLARLENGF